MVGLGILCGLTLGLVLLLLRRKPESSPAQLPAATDLPWIDLDAIAPLPLEQLPAAKPSALQRPGARPAASTVTVSNAKPTLVLRAGGDRSWSAWCRTVGPPGSFAAFSIGSDRSSRIMVPAGSVQRMRLPAGEYLYAQGDVPGVIVSVSAGED